MNKYMCVCVYLCTYVHMHVCSVHVVYRVNFYDENMWFVRNVCYNGVIVSCVGSRES